ncbi:hypothetical protein [Clostridium sp. Marseille-P2415]|uniref:hypothetical protein n=1 Tax=Clostridium sp. Marseille-P2415 TaxID=1805471 RepID=UPI0009889505|nr:hypothetical protein [Clostridium sp. Marseille-P2415]
MERYTEEMKLWLFNLACGNLNDENTLKGFIKYYVLYDFGVSQVINDIVFHTMFGTGGVINARESIIKALNQTIQTWKEDIW